MLFNSIEFAIFLPVVFLLYWFVFSRSAKWQNVCLLVASYVFYGMWDWRFLGLLFFTSLTTWCSGLLIDKYRLQYTENQQNASEGGVKSSGYAEQI